MARSHAVARGLGLFSLGLGIVQVAAPRRFGEAIGVRPRGERDAIVRLVGVREILAGTGLVLGRRLGPWLWMRVAGDVMDVALLSRARRARGTDGDRVSGTMAAAVGVAAVDVLSSLGNGNQDGHDGHEHDGHERGMRRERAGSRAVRKAITVNRPVNEVYDLWHDFRNLPRFMKHLVAVDVLDSSGERTRWTAKGPAGSRVAWDAETVEDRPNELISWRSIEGSDVWNRGVVRFTPAPGGRGTEVHVEIEYAPPLGPLGVLAARISGEEPSQQTADDLRRFKQIAETGEVVVSDAVIGERRLRQRPGQPPRADEMAGVPTPAGRERMAVGVAS